MLSDPQAAVALCGPLQSTLEGLQSTVESSASENGDFDSCDVDAPSDSPGEKEERFEDGVDEIFGQLEDTDEYEKLDDKLDPGILTSTVEESEDEVLNALSRTEPFETLCEMYAGIAESDSPSTYEGIWRDEWDDDEAGSSARRRVQEQAALNAAAMEALAMQGSIPEAEMCEAEAITSETSETPPDGGDSEAELAEATDPTAQFLDATVEAEVPSIESVVSAEAIMGSEGADGPFSVPVEWRAHQNAMPACVTESNEDTIGFTDRLGDLWNHGILNFGEGFIEGMGKQIFDLTITNAIVNYGDDLFVRGVDWLAAKSGDVAKLGGNSVPFVGPMIQLIYNGFTADSFGQFIGYEKGLDAITGLSDNWDQWRAGAAAADSFSDWLGIYFAICADLFQVVADVLTSISTVCSMLSAFCYIAAGILLVVGLLLSWCGIGVPIIATTVPLLTGWGSSLAAVPTALIVPTLAIQALAVAFRVASMFLVPEEMYANQVGALSSQSNQLGGMTGTYTTNQMANAHTARQKQRAADAETAGTSPNNQAAQESGQATAQQDSSGIRGRLRAGMQGMSDRIAGTPLDPNTRTRRDTTSDSDGNSTGRRADPSASGQSSSQATGGGTSGTADLTGAVVDVTGVTDLLDAAGNDSDDSQYSGGGGPTSDELAQEYAVYAEEANQCAPLVAQLDEGAGSPIDAWLTLLPPVDIDATQQLYEEAANARYDHDEAHLIAFGFYTAEMLYNDDIQAGEALREEITAHVESTEAYTSEIEDGVSQEGERQAAINEETAGEVDDEGGGGIIMGIIGGIGDYMDYLSGAPDSGTMDSGGEAVSGGTDMAGEQSQATQAEANTASESKVGVLGEIEVCRAEVQTDSETNQSTVEGRIAEQESGREEVKQLKANWLLTREERRAEADTLAQQFLSDYEALSSWADDYQAQRSEVLSSTEAG